jgi:transcriptional regulator GlxA family with amidase domain
VRHGTTTLFAALKVATGTITAAHYRRRRRIKFLDFMNRLVAAYPERQLIHRAEDFMRSRVAEPIALHEVADAAGCSVRKPATRIPAVPRHDTGGGDPSGQARGGTGQILAFGEGAGTVTEIAYQYGFTNPGRFAGLYRETFGVSPAEDLRRNPSHRTRR